MADEAELEAIGALGDLAGGHDRQHDASQPVRRIPVMAMSLGGRMGTRGSHLNT
jgi:hypothetical protein